MRRFRRSSAGLVLLGAIGVGFFLGTDPVLGIDPLRVRGINPVDLVQETRPGTFVGLVGSGAILLLGTWLITRRAPG